MKRRIWIDTDTASDDVVALIIALKHPDVEVVGMSIVAGNVPLDMAVQNALITVERCGAKVPVHAGAARPLSRPLESAQYVHGKDGMGDIGLDLHGRVPTSTDGVGAMIEAFRAEPGQIELVTLGPLTNVAIALRSEANFVSWVKRCVSMAGTGILPGNVTALSEFNVWADPEAAHMVFASGLHIEMVGWDVSWQDAVIMDPFAAELRALSPLAEFAIDIQRHVREFCHSVTQINGFDFPDPIAMCVAIDDSIVTKEETRYVEVILGEGHARGQTMVDWLGVTRKAANTRVVLRCDQTKFQNMLRAALRG
ncbi:MAG: nucleoside hydrolase [Ilumatobacteraceae bacterium]